MYFAKEVLESSSKMRQRWEDEVKKLVTRLRKAKCEVELSKLTPIDDREVLTGRQEEIIMMAFEMGYFETPRKVKLSISKAMAPAGKITTH